MKPPGGSERGRAVGRLALANARPICFVTVALCLAGGYLAFHTPSSVFPRTDFPRVVILVDNGVMPADEMMATVTRPIEEAMKDIPGTLTIRSATGRGSAEVNVFFDWESDMIQSELHVLGRLAQIRSALPATAETNVWRLTFAAFPILGISLTSEDRDLTELWEKARYDLKPRFLRIPGVARVDLVGGRPPEYHVIADTGKLLAAGLGLGDLTGALERNNLIASAGLYEHGYRLYLTTVDGRVRTPEEIGELVVAVRDSHPVRIADCARIEEGAAPVFNRVTADGVDAVLLNIRSQPDGSTLGIADALKDELDRLHDELPADMRLAFFYDQSVFVRESVGSVWEAIIFGLLLSVAIMYAFLRSWGSTLTAIVVIPVTVLITLAAMHVAGMTLNLMTLGGIAAAIGLVIDDAIVVVEAIHFRAAAGRGPAAAIEEGVSEILHPLVGSTLTPVVVFVPLAFLTGITGVFFRALALTMVVSLLTSLALAVTLTPSLAGWLVGSRKGRPGAGAEGGFIMRRLVGLYELAMRVALRHRAPVVLACVVVAAAGWGLYRGLATDFLPEMDEGGFVIDYVAPPGTSLTETDRQLRSAESILRATPEVESFSRRTGARLALAIAEPHTGDFLVKLRSDRVRATADVIAELRRRINGVLPGLEWEFPGILGDLIGDLTWSPAPIEIKLFSTDLELLKRKAPEIEQRIQTVAGVVDSFDGLVYTGDSLSFRVNALEAGRLGLTAADLADTLETALLGRVTSSVLEGDRLEDVRVMVEPSELSRLDGLRALPVRTPAGALVQLAQVADMSEEPGQLELHREDLRQNISVTARLEGRDMGSAIREIRELLARDADLEPGMVELGGLYRQQQEAFRNLLLVLVMAMFLVFTVLLLEFRSFSGPVAIVAGSVLALVGTILALRVTGISLNVVSFLGAIIGVGIVAKNGILMLDHVDHLRAGGHSLDEALVGSGRRRLRPVLMTSLAAAMGLLPLAHGIGAGADMLRPLAVGVIGALAISVLLSLIATPVVCSLMRSPRQEE